jgi:hypothetical protein
MKSGPMPRKERRFSKPSALTTKTGTKQPSLEFSTSISSILATKRSHHVCDSVDRLFRALREARMRLFGIRRESTIPVFKSNSGEAAARSRLNATDASHSIRYRTSSRRRLQPCARRHASPFRRVGPGSRAARAPCHGILPSALRV